MKLDSELVVGWLVVLVLGGLVYLSLQFGQISFAGTQHYRLTAEFSDAGGLQSGARVEVAGVEIGRVESVALTDTLTQARATLSIQPDIRLPRDSRAAIKTAGLIGERFIDIEIGPAAETLSSGGRIQHTESATDILDTVGQVLFGNLNAAEQTGSAAADDSMFDLSLD